MCGRPHGRVRRRGRASGGRRQRSAGWLGPWGRLKDSLVTYPSPSRSRHGSPRARGRADRDVSSTPQPRMSCARDQQTERSPLAILLPASGSSAGNEHSDGPCPRTARRRTAPLTRLVRPQHSPIASGLMTATKAPPLGLSLLPTYPSPAGPSRAARRITSWGSAVSDSGSGSSQLSIGHYGEHDMTDRKSVV